MISPRCPMLSGGAANRTLHDVARVVVFTPKILGSKILFYQKWIKMPPFFQCINLLWLVSGLLCEIE